MAQSSTRATMKVAAVSRGKLLKGEKANVPGTSHEKKSDAESQEQTEQGLSNSNMCRNHDKSPGDRVC